MIALLLISYLIVTVLAGAIADGLNNGGSKKVGHVLEAAEVGLALAGATIFGVTGETLLPYLVGYIGLRIAFFDMAYNITRGLPVFFQGKSSYWDLFLSRYPVFGVMFARIIFLTLGVGVIIKFF